MISPASLNYVAEILEEANISTKDGTILLEYVIVNFNNIIEQENYCSNVT